MIGRRIHIDRDGDVILTSQDGPLSTCTVLGPPDEGLRHVLPGYLWEELLSLLDEARDGHGSPRAGETQRYS